MCVFLASEVALELANFALKSTKCDDTWEQLLSTYTLHCIQGRSIFEVYRSYLGKQENVGTDEYYQKLVETYERELSLPLKDMEDTYIELKVSKFDKSLFSVYRKMIRSVFRSFNNCGNVFKFFEAIFTNYFLTDSDTFVDSYYSLLV